MKSCIRLTSCMGLVLLLSCNRKSENDLERQQERKPDSNTSTPSESSRNGKPSQAFLTPNDFNNSGYTPQSDLVGIESHSTFFQNPWYVANIADAEIPQDNDMIFEVRGKDTLILAYYQKTFFDPKQTGDITMSEVQTEKYTELYEEKWFSEITCSDVDLSEFNGKIYSFNWSIFLSKEIAAKCLGANTIKFLENSIKGDRFNNSKISTSDAEGKPCILTKVGDSYKLSNCFKRQASYMTTPAGTSKESHELKCVDLVVPKTGQFFSSGKIEGKINNFSGALTYFSTNTVPTYQFSNGTVSKSGNVTDLPAFPPFTP